MVESMKKILCMLWPLIIHGGNQPLGNLEFKAQDTSQMGGKVC